MPLAGVQLGHYLAEFCSELCGSASHPQTPKPSRWCMRNGCVWQLGCFSRAFDYPRRRCRKGRIADDCNSCGSFCRQGRRAQRPKLPKSLGLCFPLVLGLDHRTSDPAHQRKRPKFATTPGYPMLPSRSEISALIYRTKHCCLTPSSQSCQSCFRPTNENCQSC